MSTARGEPFFFFLFPFLSTNPLVCVSPTSKASFLPWTHAYSGEGKALAVALLFLPGEFLRFAVREWADGMRVHVG